MTERRGSAGWWAREGRLCAEDGHPAAALYAYSVAVELAESRQQREALLQLIEEVASGADT